MVGCFFLNISQTKAAQTLFDFTDLSAQRNWVNVNDSVMGGVSIGRHRVTDEGHLRFVGSLSLANNGGFASIRSRPSQLEFNRESVLVLRVRGDGRKYYVDLRSPTRQMAFSYRVSIQTKADQWQDFRIPVSTFKPTSFGRTLSNASGPDATRVNSIGFTIADKKAGPFQLDVDWIKVDRPRSAQ
jgi:monofunctional biosynthetic peptidoglycan transglycosylase